MLQLRILRIRFQLSKTLVVLQNYLMISSLILSTNCSHLINWTNYYTNPKTRNKYLLPKLWTFDGSAIQWMYSQKWR